jgi:hypothetical protein
MGLLRLLPWLLLAVTQAATQAAPPAPDVAPVIASVTPDIFPTSGSAVTITVRATREKENGGSFRGFT